MANFPVSPVKDDEFFDPDTKNVYKWTGDLWRRKSLEERVREVEEALKQLGVK
jgi:hypothetical protein